jgi:hypothetical protein
MSDDEDAYWERLHQREQEEREQEREFYEYQMQLEYEKWMFGRWLTEYVGGGVL